MLQQPKKSEEGLMNLELRLIKIKWLKPMWMHLKLFNAFKRITEAVFLGIFRKMTLNIRFERANFYLQKKKLRMSLLA